MRCVAALLLAIAVPAQAGVRSRTFRVGATVSRSDQVGVHGSVLRVSGRTAVSVVTEAGPQRLVGGEASLPPGTLRVTILY